MIDEGVQVESPDIGAIFEAALEASRKTTGKKRKYLKKALENAFSLKMYEEGQVLRFFRILGELEYGDVLVLSCVLESKDRFFTPTDSKYSGVLKPAAFPEAVRDNLDFHAKVLETHFLATYVKSVSCFQANSIVRDFIWFVTADDEDLENDDE